MKACDPVPDITTGRGVGSTVCTVGPGWEGKERRKIKIRKIHGGRGGMERLAHI